MFGEYMFLFAPQQVGISYKVKKQGNYLEQILLHIHKKITQKHWYSKKASYMTHCPALKYAKRTCFKTGCLLIAVFTLSGKHMLTYIVPPFFYYFHFTRHIICCQSRFYCFIFYSTQRLYYSGKFQMFYQKAAVWDAGA